MVPFAGSGSECVAAKALGLPFLGIELNPKYVALGLARLEGRAEGEEVILGEQGDEAGVNVPVHHPDTL